MSKFTPGPWLLDKYGSLISSSNQTVAFFGVRLNGRDEAIANTQLISAAPDMLEALQYQKRMQNGDSSCELQEFLHIRDAAIAKALGDDLMEGGK